MQAQVYSIIRCENRKSGVEHHVGHVLACGHLDAIEIASGLVECDDLHHLIALPCDENESASALPHIMNQAVAR